MLPCQPVIRKAISKVLFADLGMIYFKCPACDIHHGVLVMGTKEPVWQWDENVESPTITPSIRARSYDKKGETCCHLFITNGKIQFLGDCTHSLAGQTVNMIPMTLTPEPLV